VYDNDHTLEGCDGKPLPESPAVYAQNIARVPVGYPEVRPSADTSIPYRDMTYEEYLAYYGDPDRHVVLGCQVEKECPCCGKWDHVQSLWGIDFMDDGEEWAAVTVDRTLTPDEALKLPGYLAEVAGELLHEAGYQVRKKGGSGQ